MSWTQPQMEANAEAAARLSDVVAAEGFTPTALFWLSKEVISEFLTTLDEEEAARLESLARANRGWEYELWACLWIAGTQPWRHQFLTGGHEPGFGREYVAALAGLRPDWMAQWWSGWLARSYQSHDDPTRAIALALTPDEFRQCFDVLSDSQRTALVFHHPQLIAELPPEAKGPLLSGMLEGAKHEEAIRPLSATGFPANTSAVIDELLSASESDAKSSLEHILDHWAGAAGSDPVTRAVQERNDALDALLRSEWDLAERTARHSPDSWATGPRPRVTRAIRAAVHAAPERWVLEVGFSLGCRIAESGFPISPDRVRAQLAEMNLDAARELVDAVYPMAELWTTLRLLAKHPVNTWGGPVENVGLQRGVQALASNRPELWAQALPWILLRSDDLGNTAEGVTLDLALTSEEVRDALRQAGEMDDETIRLKAQGLLSLLDDVENPGTQTFQALANLSARLLDGTPMFPNPLGPLSATWLSSIGLEKVIADGVRRAAIRFADVIRDQGSDVEEALTRALVEEISFQFRGAGLRMALQSPAHPAHPAQSPALSVQQRPSAKKTEEPVYGCDIAWLVEGDVRGRYRSTWADLVQVKKSDAITSGAAADTWQIKAKQLNDILRWSATAAYWLITAAGDLLVVPASHLAALREGTGRQKQKSFRVGYHEVRHVAIALEQYLTFLLIGHWLGTSAEEVLRFARGEDGTIRPRLVIEVRVSAGDTAPPE